MPEFKLFHAQSPNRKSPKDESFQARHHAYLNLVMNMGPPDFGNLLFEHVATLNCRDMETVFSLTNSRDAAWFEDPDAGALYRDLRSTSIGDLIQDEDGVFHLCATFGWSPLAAETQIQIKEPRVECEPRP